MSASKMKTTTKMTRISPYETSNLISPWLAHHSSFACYDMLRRVVFEKDLEECMERSYGREQVGIPGGETNISNGIEIYVRTKK